MIDLAQLQQALFPPAPPGPSDSTASETSVTVQLQQLRDFIHTANQPAAILHHLPTLGQFFQATVEQLAAWQPPPQSSPEAPRQLHVLLLEALLAFGHCCVPEAAMPLQSRAELLVARNWVQQLLAANLLEDAPAAASDADQHGPQHLDWPLHSVATANSFVSPPVTAALRLALLRELMYLFRTIVAPAPDAPDALNASRNSWTRTWLSMPTDACRQPASAAPLTVLRELCAVAAPVAAARGATDVMAKALAKEALAAATRLLQIPGGAVNAAQVQEAVHSCIAAAGGLSAMDFQIQTAFFRLALAAPVQDVAQRLQQLEAMPLQQARPLPKLAELMQAWPAVTALRHDALAIDSFVDRLQSEWLATKSCRDCTGRYTRLRLLSSLMTALDPQFDNVCDVKNQSPLTELCVDDTAAQHQTCVPLSHLHTVAWRLASRPSHGRDIVDSWAFLARADDADVSKAVPSWLDDMLAEPGPAFLRRVATLCQRHASSFSASMAAQILLVWHFILYLDRESDLLQCNAALSLAFGTAQLYDPHLWLDACELLFSARQRGLQGSGGWMDETAASTLRVVETVTVGLHEHLTPPEHDMARAKDLVNQVQEHFCLLYA